jgi:hypothetical protein
VNVSLGFIGSISEMMELMRSVLDLVDFCDGILHHCSCIAWRVRVCFGFSFVLQLLRFNALMAMKKLL